MALNHTPQPAVLSSLLRHTPRSAVLSSLLRHTPRPAVLSSQLHHTPRPAVVSALWHHTPRPAVFSALWHHTPRPAVLSSLWHHTPRLSVTAVTSHTQLINIFSRHLVFKPVEETLNVFAARDVKEQSCEQLVTASTQRDIVSWVITRTGDVNGGEREFAEFNSVKQSVSGYLRPWWPSFFNCLQYLKHNHFAPPKKVGD